jgi:hypothetical protein
MTRQDLTNQQLVSSSVMADLGHDQQIKELHVSCAYYRKLSKQGAPSILVAIYHCGTKIVREVVCFEHGGVIRKQAISWWKQRTNIPIPRSVDEALTNAVHLRVPITLRITANTVSRKYPVITESIFRTIN